MFFLLIAFSSEVDAGSRQENASNKKLEPGSASIRTNEAPASAGATALRIDRRKHFGEQQLDEFLPIGRSPVLSELGDHRVGRC
jgi:hypothetical protein